MFATGLLKKKRKKKNKSIAAPGIFLGKNIFVPEPIRSGHRTVAWAPRKDSSEGGLCSGGNLFGEVNGVTKGRALTLN